MIGAAWPLVARAALQRRCSERRAVVLTYDDGPSRALTPRVLELLAAHDATATFFALGERAETHGPMLDRVAAAGHEIGCHSYAHRHAWRSAPWTAVRDVAAGYAALAPWIGPDGPFRPPYGKVTTATLAAIRRRRAPLCLWTHDSGDTFATLPDPDAVVRAVIDAGGGVVLLHDFDRDPPEPERAEHVLAVTAGLLRRAAAHRLTVEPMGALL